MAAEQSVKDELSPMAAEQSRKVEFTSVSSEKDRPRTVSKTQKVFTHIVLDDCKKLEALVSNLKLPTEIYDKLLDAGCTNANMRDLPKDVLLGILIRADIPLFAITRLIDAAKDIDPEEDQIKIFSPDSKTNPDDDAKEMFVIWLKGLFLSLLVIVAPCLCIGFANDKAVFGIYDDEGGDCTDDAFAGNLHDDGEINCQGVMDERTIWYTCYIPGFVVFLLGQFQNPRIATMFAADTLQERSLGIDYKETMTSQLTNTGIVAALLLTILLASLQAGQPTGNRHTLLSQWYLIFNMIGVFYALMSTIMSSLCLMYLQPLKDDAVEDFISIMALYFGEPILGICMTLVMAINAVNLYAWGQWGQPAGIFSSFISWWAVFRSLTALSNLMLYKNPYVDSKVRAERAKVHDRSALHYLSGTEAVEPMLK